MSNFYVLRISQSRFPRQKNLKQELSTDSFERHNSRAGKSSNREEQEETHGVALSCWLWHHDEPGRKTACSAGEFSSALQDWDICNPERIIWRNSAKEPSIRERNGGEKFIFHVLRHLLMPIGQNVCHRSKLPHNSRWHQPTSYILCCEVSSKSRSGKRSQKHGAYGCSIWLLNDTGQLQSVEECGPKQSPQPQWLRLNPLLTVWETMAPTELREAHRYV